MNDVLAPFVNIGWYQSRIIPKSDCILFLFKVQ
jgi:hypothetical protein